MSNKPNSSSWRVATAAVFLIVVITTRDGAAYNSVDVGTSVYPSRWMLCRPAKKKRLPAPKARGATSAPKLVPVPLRSKPPTLKVVPDVADEVAIVDPVPIRAEDKTRLALQPEQPVLIAQGPHTYRCLGAVRGKAGVLRVLNAPAGARFYRRHDGFSWMADNMLAAASWNFKQAIPALRATLARPIPPKQYPWRYERLRSQAAVALTELGDQPSAPKIVSVLQELEGRTFGSHWADVLRGLGRLAPDHAERYAIGLLTRLTNAFFMYNKHWGALLALDYLTKKRRDAALPILRRLTKNTGPFYSDTISRHFCRLTAARLRLGDEPMLAEARRDLSGELRKQWPSYCYSLWMPAVFGDRPEDAEVLVKRRNYDLILRLIEQLNRLEKQEANKTPSAPLRKRIRKARATLLQGLKKLSSAPAVSQPNHRAYHETTRVRHLAALAGLGDGRAKKKLYHMIDHQSFSGYQADAPWDGAYYALRLGLPKAMDHALKRLRKGLTERPGNHRWFEFTGSVTQTSRVRLLEEVVRQSPSSDIGWTVSLLDFERDAREKALYLIARRKPPGTCQQLAKVASQATEQAVRDAFWGLSVLGIQCQDAMVGLARDTTQPPVVRGMAVELLAMIRSPQARRLIGQLEQVPKTHGYRRRARVIDKSRQ